MNRLQQRSRCRARWPRREPQREMRALIPVLLAFLSLCAADAKQPEQALQPRDPEREVQPVDHPSSIGEFPSPIVIQGEEPRPDDSTRKFRDTLAPSAGVREHRLADGTVELITRFGRFCVKPSPLDLQPHIGGELTLVARCTSL